MDACGQPRLARSRARWIPRGSPLARGLAPCSAPCASAVVTDIASGMRHGIATRQPHADRARCTPIYVHGIARSRAKSSARYPSERRSHVQLLANRLESAGLVRSMILSSTIGISSLGASTPWVTSLACSHPSVNLRPFLILAPYVTASTELDAAS